MMRTDKKLNPCPNCGANAGKLISCTNRGETAQMFFVRCKSCMWQTAIHYAGSTGQFKAMEAKATNEWNEVGA